MKKKKGFSMIELLTTMAILGVVLTMVYQNYFYQQKGMKRQQMWSEMNMKARKAVNYMVNDLRQIGFSGLGLSPTNHFGIVVGAADSIVYTHDIEGNNSGVVDAEDIHSFTLNGDTLFIDGDLAARSVDYLAFIYFDNLGDTAAPPVTEVNISGDWILPIGSRPISRIEFTIRFVFSNGKDTVIYSDVAGIRNLRP